MRRDDRDDPFDEFFREIERMMDSMTGDDAGFGMDDSGFGSDVHFSVYQEDDQVRVVGDLPGVAKEDIDIKCDGKQLTVGAATATTEFEERLTLPVRVDEHSAAATYNNGVLEVTFDRADASTGIDLS
ncbi:MAG: Hsp20/alpha crystallin family protein [Haloarculaceae archaeon]